MNDYPLLNVVLPEKEIFLRLGGHLTRTRLLPEEKKRFLSLALRAFEAARPRGRWEIFPVAKNTEKGIVLADGTLIPGGDFAARCGDIRALWCGAVTLGSGIIRLCQETASIAEKAVFDAAGSEIADAAMDALQELARQTLLRQGMALDIRRYSPGYGDMPLEVQTFIFERLRLDELDMSLNEVFYMIPEKSVTAFAGIKQGISNDQK